VNFETNSKTIDPTHMQNKTKE